MKYHVVLGVFCVAVSLYVVLLYTQTPVLHLIPQTNYNKIEQHFIFHGEDRLQRTEFTKKEKKRTKLSEDKIGIDSSTKLQENTSKMKTSEAAVAKHPQKFAPRTNLIILSPGRGGSSFLGSMFDSNPQIMYWYEPLRVIKKELFNASLLRESTEQINFRKTCLDLIESLFKCDFSNIANVTLSKFSRDNSRRQSKALTSGYLCPNKKCLPLSSALLSKTCNSYKHTVIKILTSRVPNNTLQSFQELFQRERYEVKLIHLVRDPRAVIYSRVSSVKWIKGSYLNQDFRLYVHGLCDPIEKNLRMGLLYPPSWLKNRFKVIRYEDLAVDTANIAQELYKFAGFDWSTSVDTWIDNHQRPPNNRRERNPYSLYRNASDVIGKWKNAPKELIEVVEDICGDLMDMLGYEKWRTNKINYIPQI